MALSGNFAGGGDVQGLTLTALTGNILAVDGAVKGKTLELNNGSFTVNATGAVNAASITTPSFSANSLTATTGTVRGNNFATTNNELTISSNGNLNTSGDVTSASMYVGTGGLFVNGNLTAVNMNVSQNLTATTAGFGPTATGNLQVNGTINTLGNISTNGNLQAGSLNAGNATINGVLSLPFFGSSAPLLQMCRSASFEVVNCASSLRYKTNVALYSSGLDLIRKLRPVTFNWKNGGMADMGLIAEEVNAIEPLLTAANEKGQIEAVKYDRIGVVLINAVKEQQSQIDHQAEQIKKQQQEIDALRTLICLQNPGADVCRRK